MKVRTRPLLVAAALLAGTVVPLAAPAVADTGPVPLGMSSLGSVVLDEAHGHLFLSGGPKGDGIRVTDLSGAPVATLAFRGAAGMTLSPDGSALWVAQPEFGLVELDTATLTARSRIPLPTGQCAGDVALTGDRVVYGYSCNQYGNGGDYGGIGVVDATTGASYGTVTSGAWYRPVVEAGPNGRVWAADAGLSPTGLYVYDVTGSAPVLQKGRPGVCSNLRDLSAPPLGGQVVTACGGTYEHEVWSLALDPVGSYFSGSYPLAGAWSGDGSTFAAGLDSAYEPDVWVYRAGEGSAEQALREVDFGATTSLLQPRGLAASHDGSRVWAVAGTAADTLALHVIDVPLAGSSRLTVSAQPSALYAGQPTTLTGRLAAPTGAPLAGVGLSVSRMSTGAAPTALRPVVTAADGSFSLADTPPLAGSWTYTVSHAADAAIASTTVLAWATQPRLSVSVKPDGPGVYGTVSLRYDGPSSSSGGPVTVTRTGGGMVATLPPVAIDSWGSGKFLDSPGPGTWTYTASVTAVGVHPAASASSTVTLAAPSALTVVAPPTAFAGAPLTITGGLSGGAGPVTGASLTVTRTGCGSWSRTAQTAADGSWSVTDLAPPTGTCTWTATYAGGAVSGPATASATTTVTLAPTTLGMDTPSPVVAGSPVVVRGTLAAGGSVVPGATVSVDRVGCSSAGWRALPVTTPNGSWSATDPAAPGGTCTYRASYAGTSTRAATTSSVSVPVPFRTTELSLSVVRGTGSSKKTAYVTAQLAAWHTGRTLRITAQPTDGAEVQLALGTVDSSGRLTATYQPKTTTTYRVTYAGDDWYAPAKAERLQ